MKFDIDYRMDYRYDAPVEDNANSLRVTPQHSTATQRLEEFTFRVSPDARVNERRDYFGTMVLEYTLAHAHEHMEVQARSRVETTEGPEPPEGTWGEVQQPSYAEDVAEYLLETRPAGRHPAFEELRGQIHAETPLAVVKNLVEAIPDRFEYKPGVTYVGSTVDDLLAGGAGVCQDFVHLSLLLLRSAGIAARYVSGYLWVEPKESGGSDSAEVATHAWLEALIPGNGSGPIWVGADPTNRRMAGEEHVKIGHGRHYRDLPPIRGVYRGLAISEVDAKVVMTRL
jgi:transglutaminase-like putative cysteine protease